MKILLFSDSHGCVNNMVKAINKNKDVDMIIHLGDYARDATALSELYPSIKIEFVKGNNDWNTSNPLEKILEIEGKKIFITHGHMYGVKKDYQPIEAKGKTIGANAVFFGHTHYAEEFFSDGMLVLNPGSIAVAAYSGTPKYCIVEIREGKILPRFAKVE